MLSILLLKSVYDSKCVEERSFPLVINNDDLSVIVNIAHSNGYDLVLLNKPIEE